MKQLPAVIRNMNVLVDGDSYAGLAQTVGLPEIVRKTEDYRGAGMLGDVGLDMGYEKMEMTVNYKGIDPRHFGQLAKCGVGDLPIRYVGSYQRQDTCETVTAEVYMRGQVMNMPLGEIALGELNEQELTYNVSYLRVIIDGIELLELDFVNGIEIINGEDKTAEQLVNLGL